QALRQQRDLRPSLTFDESLHDRPRQDLDGQKVRQSQAFSHSLDPKLPFTKGRNRQGAATQFAAIPVMTLRGHLNVGMLAIQSELIGSARTQEEMRCTALPRI
ncbi:hypothetical protein, partial [Pseudomonas sp. 382]|uniref:hypothetical protein n=1 Tax=Pseudomonas sp. 382 TaxID=1751969 RepID=UPI000C457911